MPMCKDCPTEMKRWAIDLCCGPITSDYIETFEESERLKWRPESQGSVSNGDKIDNGP
jgi:hypothetical protein